MYFKDRQDAGQQLAKKLLEYKNATDCIVLGLPRGGVVTAFEVTKELKIPLDILVPRKLRAPFNPELGIGAVERDALYLNHSLIQTLDITKEYLDNEIRTRKKEVLERLIKYRKNKPPLVLDGQTAIIIDDGLATGATMMAAILQCKQVNAKEIIVAIPVAPPDTLKMIEAEVDKVICLFSTPSFYAVGQFYENFNQTEDSEVINLLAHS